MKEGQNESYRQLIQAIKEGNEQAFVMLYDLYSKDLSNYILSKVSQIDLAQDILHDLFLSVWKNRKQLTEIKSIPAYLYSSCRYLIMAYYRKRAAQNLVNFNIEEIDILDNSVSLEDRLHYRFIIDMLENEIENLPQKCQEVFKLSRYEYLSNKEIADRLQIAESTVEKHINKALKRLRTLSKAYTLFI